MNFSYRIECEHGDGMIRLSRAKKSPPDSLLVKCPFGGGEDVIGILIPEAEADAKAKEMLR